MRNKGVHVLCFITLLAIFMFGSIAHCEDVTVLNAMIRAQGKKWVAGETSMTRLTPEQQTRRLGLHRSTSVAGKVLTAQAPLASLPDSLDWRSSGYVTSIKDQGGCGSCWAFATAGAAESAILIASGTPLDLAEQVLVSCSGAGDCNGGYVDQASNYIQGTGLPIESCYPYTGTNGTCSTACDKWQDTANKIQSWSWVVSYGTTPTTAAIKNALYTYGPLVTTMAVYNDFFSYASGVYAHTTGTLQGYHAIIIVGYNETDKYFIVKNSWGPYWGESGYFRIAYSELTGATQFGQGTIAYTAPQNTYTLSVSKTGGGTGTISSYPTGINCGATCSAKYAKQTSVLLTATAAYGSTFAGWSGVCYGTGTCNVTMDSTKSVIATFNPATYTLNVSKTGTGTGTVTSNPAGISCGTACTGSFTAGSIVTLTATPNAGSTFTGWSGVCAGTGTCTLNMDAAKSVYATFNLPAGPRINSIVDGQTYSTTIGPRTTITIFGSNFSMGSNTVQLQRAGYADVWLYNGDGHYFWDGNGTQINASLDSRAAAGTWTVTVRNSSGTASSPYTLTIQNNLGPTIASIVDGQTYGSTIKPNTTISIFGSNFSIGSNKIRLQRAGYADVWLYNGDGHYFWDYNGTQINASLDNRAAGGTWTVTVQNASGGVSSPYTMTIQDTNAGNSAYWCYSTSYPQYGYTNWLCNAAYRPTYCYTSSWQWTTCPH